jgi:lysozyme
LNISASGRDFIERHEGLRLQAYRPTVNDVLTIGYGSTSGVYQGQTITPFEAEQLLTRDLLPVEAAIARLIQVQLWQFEYDALCSLLYNIGFFAFAKSAARDDLNAGHKDAFCDNAFSQAHGWVHQAGIVLPGLVARRDAECKLFRDADYGA